MLHWRVYFDRDERRFTILFIIKGRKKNPFTTLDEQRCFECPTLVSTSAWPVQSKSKSTDLQVSSSLPIKMSTHSVTAAFKLSVCRSAGESGNREAGRRFSMDESVTWRWRTGKAMIEKRRFLFFDGEKQGCS